MQRRAPDIKDYWQIFVRRRWWVIIPAVLVFGIVSAISVNLPRVYKSDTVILVDAQTIPKEFVRGSMDSDIANRLASISQDILSRTNLQKLIDQFGLYKDQPKLSPEDIIEQMRKDIVVEMVEDKTGDNRPLNGFKISYSGPDPKVVQSVTRQLGSQFIEGNLKFRQKAAEGTSSFLQDELNKSRDKLQAQEKALTDFKAKHMGAMPDQQAANLQMIGQFQSLLQTNSDALGRLQQEKTILESVTDTVGKKALPSPERARLQEQLNAKKAELSLAEQKYQPTHPDLIRIQQEEAAIEQHLKSLAAEQAADPDSTQAQSIKLRTLALNQEVKDRNARQTQIEQRIKLLQSKVDALPAIEAEGAELARDYGVTKEQYQTLLQKVNASTMAADVEHKAEGEQLRVVDPASLPTKPYKPNLILINALGLLGGLALGAGLGAFQEFKDSAIYSEADLSHYIPVPILGTMSVVLNDESSKDLRRKAIFAWGMSSAVVTMVIAIAGYLYLHRAAFEIATN